MCRHRLHERHRPAERSVDTDGSHVTARGDECVIG